MSNADQLVQAMELGFSDGEMELDVAAIEAMTAVLEPMVHEDVVMVMRGRDDKFVGTYAGLEEMATGWSDWLEPFENLRFVFEKVEQVGENVLMLGTQVGTTRRGGVEVEQPSATVWKFRDGLITRVEFHLDREQAIASAATP